MLVGSAVIEVEVGVESAASAAEGSVELEPVPAVDAAAADAAEGSLAVHKGTMLPVVGLYEKIWDVWESID